ncbi:type IV toxin-antitoxin system AbiEi family antitoxin domain-containing protein [Streptomyces meridianus]|uniref:Type IV toxin-antitoxin system AbiEi family antitoxin domain-containing protein n=1 Tax=Streptomyces meridianus TaxID=2938945 RepID=A0ABT0X631_9ACTN|nr:type IV toxin-antitoxin system AbiEi family antitoxin domain-containing protein [Streptomyces meridianus]MCM2577785.1 type IV toxin-antitoxin system AbiEi family antitoxin domain-containing protein [Streptomyces meridianus]
MMVRRHAIIGTHDLPETFRYSEARRLGVSDRRLRRLLEEGQVELISRGLYRRADAAPEVDLDLIEIAHRVPDGTLCLVSALARHGLTDQIPAAIDIAIPRGRRSPRLTAPVSWHHFSRETFSIGRELLVVGPGDQIGIYDAERCIIDVFRLRHREGSDLAVEALRTWLRRRGSSPARLMAMARHFPQAAAPLRTTLEVLL